MSDHAQKPTTKIVTVNWEGLRRFLGWTGTIEDLKRLKLERSDDFAETAGTPVASAAKRG